MSGQNPRWRSVSDLLPAATVQDYRFLYPSTLFVQCFTLAAALGGTVSYLRPQKPSGRRP